MKILNKEPLSITAGTAIRWKRYFEHYPPSVGYGLVYYFRSNTSGFDVSAKIKDDYYLVELSSSDTANYLPGLYHWQSYLIFEDEIGLDRRLIGNGKLTIEPNFGTINSYDARSHVKKTLDALEATILGKASRDQLSYSISGRSLSRLSPSELLKWRDLYRAEYVRELQQEKLNSGLNVNNSIKIRFTNR